MIVEEQFGHTLGTLSLSLWFRWGVFLLAALIYIVNFLMGFV